MKTKTLLTTSILTLLVIIGCKKNESTPDIRPPEMEKAIVRNPKNPYSLVNMRKALAYMLVGDVQLTNANKLNFVKGKLMFTKGSQLGINRQMTLQDGQQLANNTISATHYYIRFMPSNEADFNILKADSAIISYPFPLDNEISEYSGSYHDPSLPNTTPTYQYAAVRVGQPIPNISYQKLEDLYIPDDGAEDSIIIVEGDDNSSYRVSGRALAARSGCEVEHNPDNEPHEPGPIDWEEVPVDPDMDPCQSPGGSGGGTTNPYDNGYYWSPNGRITLYDESRSMTIGVEGLKVRARRWFTTYSGITNAEGYYVVNGQFTKPANYWLDFERYDFSVNDHSGGPMEIGGPKQRASWNRTLDGYEKFCGNIFRAAHYYYYKDIQGLRRPPQNSFWSTQVKLAAFDWYENKDNGDMWAGRNLLFGSLIHIYHPQNGTVGTYATTIHELAHAVHWDMSDRILGPFLTIFGQTDTRVCETWATGVQWYLTRMQYPSYNGRPNTSGNYTNLVMDLVDAPGSEFAGFGRFAPTDQVIGYNMSQIQDALRNQKTMNDWKVKLYNDYNNATKQHLDALFNYWSN
jgi:hypothetical protein